MKPKRPATGVSYEAQHSMPQLLKVVSTPSPQQRRQRQRARPCRAVVPALPSLPQRKQRQRSSRVVQSCLIPNPYSNDTSESSDSSNSDQAVSCHRANVQSCPRGLYEMACQGSSTGVTGMMPFQAQSRPLPRPCCSESGDNDRAVSCSRGFSHSNDASESSDSSGSNRLCRAIVQSCNRASALGSPGSTWRPKGSRVSPLGLSSSPVTLPSCP